MKKSMLEMPRKPKKEIHPRTGSLKGFASKVLTETSLSAVVGIISARSTCQKVFKTSVFLFSVMGFCYQSGTFLQYILGYPTIISIQILTPKELELPAFTFCNNNGISAIKFCRKYRNRCELVDAETCTDYTCEYERILVPRKKYYSFMNEIEVEEFLNLTYSLEYLMTSFRTPVENFVDKYPIQGPIMRSKTIYGYGPVSCYSVHSLVESKDTPAVMENSHKLEIRLPIMEFVFNVQKRDAFILSQKPGMTFEIHSPYLTLNPNRKGIFMQPGKSYKIFLSTKVELLQPYPYDTDCINYTEIWLSKNKTGPRIQEMCIEHCYLELFPDCIPSVIVGLTSRTVCANDDTTYDIILDSALKLMTCFDTCKKDCLRLTYTQNFQEQFTDDLGVYQNITEWNPDLIYVEVYFDGPEVTVLEHRPQYQDIEVFSYIGGFIGVWLGISLIQLTDFLEAVVQIVSFYFKSKRNARVNTLNGDMYTSRRY